MKGFSQSIAKDARCRMPFVRSLTPSRSLRVFAGLFISTLAAIADPSARLETPTTEAWTGQRIPFFIELRAPGSFDGAPSFDIPRMPQSVVLRIGNPVLGSITEGDIEYFTQRHEFALFSQARGEIELPSITARFSHKKGYTGPSYDATVKVPAASFAIRRPPGSEDLGFVVTTKSLEIDEHWAPEPGPVETGAVFKRTITQNASELTGIALAPASTDPIEGLRIYAGEPEVTDRHDRGQLEGERTELVTYLVEEPGRHSLPEIVFRWWNPETETLESTTLPAVRFTATAPPAPPPPPSPPRFLVPLLILILLTAAFHYRSSLMTATSRLRDFLDPPARRASRRFVRACRRNDAPVAIRAWANVRPNLSSSVLHSDLQIELPNLQRQLYGRGPATPWSGTRLADAYLAAESGDDPVSVSDALPPLNP